MIAQDCLQTIPLITKSSLVKDCIEIMQDLKCFQIVVLEDDKPIGKVDLDECMHSQDDTIENLIDTGLASVNYQTHIFDLLRVFKESGADICAVLGVNFEYLGIATRRDVLDKLSQSLSIEQQELLSLLRWLHLNIHLVKFAE